MKKKPFLPVEKRVTLIEEAVRHLPNVRVDSFDGLVTRYMEEHEKMPAVEACKVALSKAIPEISSSCLTTVSGMLAMMFMQFKLGYDMGFVLVKAILFSLVAVFFFMPGILLIFSNLISTS